MKVPDPETIRISAIAHLRELGLHVEADLLSRCKLEMGETGQRYAGSTELGLNLTLRSRATDLARFEDQSSFWKTPTEEFAAIQNAIEAVLPSQLKVHDLAARSLLVDRNEFDKTELERLIEAQIDLMIAVATGGPRIQVKNDEYKNRQELISDKLQSINKSDPNPFKDLWAWYGRWSSGDLLTYQSRRDYVRSIYRPMLEHLAGAPTPNKFDPSHETTGWEKVDRTVDKIINGLIHEKDEEEYQAVGLFCRECLISLAQAVYNPEKHTPSDGIQPSETDAYRMLEAYFSFEFHGTDNEPLRRHAKASLILANNLQHKRTATYKDAALCSEATRTVVNIVAITSGRR